MEERFGEEVRMQLAVLSALVREVSARMSDEIDDLARLTLRTLREGGRLFFAGNGGSAADAQHLAAEYVVRFARARGPLPALALTTDTSVLTAAGNDFGFDSIFERQVEALAHPGDLVVLHSTSGDSENLVRAATAARVLGARTVGVLGKGGGRLQDHVDLALVVPSDVTARVQEIHLAIGHIVCDIVDRSFSDKE